MDEDEQQELFETGKRKQKARATEAEPHNNASDTQQLDSWYTIALDEHVSDTRNRLIGPRISQSWRKAPSLRKSTIVPPINAEFTPEDKAAFFLALARHSRFRPELIAADIGRHEVEVEHYLDLLEDGFAAVQRNTGSQEGQRDRAGRYKSRHPWEEGLSPAAREVSAKWIKEEESIAERLESAVREKSLEISRLEKDILRKDEKRAVLRSIRQPKQLAAHRPLEDEALRKLEKKWALEDYMEELSSDKIDTLERLIAASWQKWAEPLSRRTGPNGQPIGASVQDGPPVIGHPRSTETRRMAADQEMIEEIQAINKKKRTPEQKGSLRVLLRRRHMRQKYRMRRLVASGMTPEEIEQQGGPDEVYWKKDVEMRANGGNRWKCPADEGRAALLRLRKAAKNLGVVDEFVHKGWDVFNLSKLKTWHECFIEKNEHGVSGEPAVLTETLSLLYDHLVSFVAALVFQTIITAEQAITLSPEAEPSREITIQHIRSTLAMRDEDPISDLLAFRKRWVPDEILEKIEEKSPYDLDDYSLPFRDMAVLGTLPAPDSMDGLDDVEAERHAENAPHDGSLDGVMSDDDLSSTLSDQEDATLDDALEVMDTGYDALHEQRLWEGHAKKTQVEDWMDPCEAQELPEDCSRRASKLHRDAKEMREDYIRTLEDVNKTRRWRRSIRNRSFTMPTTRLKLQTTKKRLYKSTAIIIESEDDL
ncbi:hypothetical protein BD324DRAFT_617965 [Kockovaella imperatae]|uniref:Uncharacterized protein n=1 Tax=Kockovaella imperatae TaxID=4999 RepID=A0A1Y1UN56_9TREE|nr:hypothetical protein BD324DRAFT_617965 [Kockovaella imperatae]ORX38947.1 hypothetical protein BD324DRAFT_617965 [Kockovaella imperatae]